jgi:very-short-patch-repair endonuclease
MDEATPPSESRPATGWASVDRVRQKDRPRVAARAQRMRLDPTTSESRLWKALRQLNKEGANFRHQCAVDDLVYDFGDYSARVLIEVDGVVHELIDDARLNDAKKDALAAREGFKLLRFRNKDVWSRLDWVIDEIHGASPSPLRGGSDAVRVRGGGQRRMKRTLQAALIEKADTITDAPHPDGCAVDLPREGEGVRRLPRRKRT